MSEATEYSGQGITATAHQATREQRVAASRAVLRVARDRDDLHLLLEALGLNSPRKDIS